MKRNLFHPVLLLSILILSTFVTEAKENSLSQVPPQTSNNKQYKECVAVSLFTREGNEINSIAENNRTIEGTNRIPEGWSVVGVTTKKEALVTSPYLVICQ